MRYRPLGHAGSAVSAITLVLDSAVAAKGADAARALIFAALEQGINSFHIDSLDRTLIRTTGEALGHVERDLLYVTLTIGPLPNGRRDFSVEGVDAVLSAVTKVSGLGYVDTIILDDPDSAELPAAAMKTIRQDERIRSLGVRGQSDVMDIYIGSSLFDVLHTPCHILLDAKQRSRLREARQQNMTIFGTDYFPPELFAVAKPEPGPAQRGLFGMLKKASAPPPAPSPYEFLKHIPGWEAEDLCLAHALLDLSLGGVLVKPTSAEHLERLATACERDMPVSLPAQLEMARVRAA
ncbi:oxidoreductase [Brevundimonas sp.]|uniref:oxidoreductase n=1 Tax=Brevundimonas sp. TaxID=1871086 RepID=UPI00289F3FA0|nr:oxidoreductase [Brevundimonas sp.]